MHATTHPAAPLSAAAAQGREPGQPEGQVHCAVLLPSGLHLCVPHRDCGLQRPHQGVPGHQLPGVWEEKGFSETRGGEDPTGSWVFVAVTLCALHGPANMSTVVAITYKHYT
eukprot:1157569-Pelagomonas_calceolata.AAC.2